MSDLKIKKDQDAIKLFYRPSNDWLDEKIAKNEEFCIYHTFNFVKGDIVNRDLTDFGWEEYEFVIANSFDDEYYKIRKEVFDIDNDIYVSKTISPKIEIFSFRQHSVLLEISMITKDPIWIGGSHENAISNDLLNAVLQCFPTKIETDRYVLSKIQSVLSEVFENVVDYEAKYDKYVAKKQAKLHSYLELSEKQELVDLFKEYEVDKYTKVLEKLKAMLNESEAKYNEKQWQNAIVDILLLLYPKYVKVLSNVKIYDPYQKKDRFLDYLFVDVNGYCDVVEIKKPFSSCIISDIPYRDNYIPKRELTGAIMQVEKYLFNMNKMGISLEQKITKDRQSELPPNLEIKIANPKGFVILGRTDSNMDVEKKLDLEVIKKKYANIIDILSYDDLCDRLERIIEKFK
ncbi:MULTISPECIES: Shedu immune nuclease family protein [unclassified Fibrobacter]|uniref:Shedu immune nuclease family protein n=1 Tax=unclassified Fibrobacter TaxID=2634177 RepID=UPI000D790BDC|nr:MULTISPECIES: Shedu immune nuclease family protein [unclassified Fibrobacter]PWJ70080.1 uncharacterized protein DUF4263 [Fibrobacter sp. UWR4]PZW73428.1 uncharacterized protein DUF4263 [Fibrobacter sp. UWR1]